MGMTRNAAFAAMVAGAGLLGVTAAYAGADDGGTKAFWLESAQVSSPAAPRDTARYVARYTPAQTTAASTAPEKDPPYFYHAMGTMSVP